MDELIRNAVKAHMDVLLKQTDYLLDPNLSLTSQQALAANWEVRRTAKRYHQWRAKAPENAIFQKADAIVEKLSKASSRYAGDLANYHDRFINNADYDSDFYSRAKTVLRWAIEEFKQI